MGHIKLQTKTAVKHAPACLLSAASASCPAATAIATGWVYWLRVPTGLEGEGASIFLLRRFPCGPQQTASNRKSACDFYTFFRFVASPQKTQTKNPQPAQLRSSVPSYFNYPSVAGIAKSVESHKVASICTAAEPKPKLKCASNNRNRSGHTHAKGESVECVWLKKFCRAFWLTSKDLPSGHSWPLSRDCGQGEGRRLLNQY